MQTGKVSRNIPIEFIPTLLFLSGLVFARQYNYALFHFLAEFFSIIISFSTFVIYWNSRRFLKGDYFLFVAVALFFVNIFDVAHALSYTGMGLFPDTSSNLPTQLWIIGRYLQAGSFVGATLYVNRKFKNVWLIFFIYSLLSGLLLGLLFIWPIFPDCYVEGIGLTSFKIISEFIISALFVISTLLLARLRDRFNKHILVFLISSLALFAAAEIIFTFYINVYGLLNMLGHILRILAYYLVYRALIKIGLQEPYDVMFHNLIENETALRQSEENYRKLVENINEVIYRIDAEGRITYISPVIENMLGYGVSEAIGAPFYETVYPDDQSLLIQKIQEAMAGNTIIHVCRLISGTGKLLWVRVSARPLFAQNKVIGAQGVLTDVNEQHIAEEMLHIKNSAVESAITGIAVTDLDGIITYANPAYLKMYGYNTGIEILGKHISDFWEDDEGGVHLTKELRADGKWVGDLLCRRQDGSIFTVEAFFSLVMGETGQPLCIMSSHLDITTRVLTEKWQNLYKKLLNTLLDVSQHASVMSEKQITQKAVEEAVIITGSEVGYLQLIDVDDAERHVTTWSEAAIEACTAEQYAHFPLENAGVWADCVRLHQPIIHNNYLEMEHKQGYPAGHVALLRHLSVPIYDGIHIEMVLGVGNKQTDYNETDVLQLQLIGDQVTKILQRKKSENGIKASLREKVVLLQEIHHRVKNNMQVISSLLDMQAMKVKEPETLEVLRESRNRVRAMAFVHDRLYRSQDLAAIDAVDYIPSLVNYLFGVYATTSSDIHLDFNIEDVALNLDIAVPCGLIINELVTNALKYAFDFSECSANMPAKKEIHVYVGIQERGHITIIISDNGIGLSENFDIGHTPSLGLQLVGLLTMQIGGKIELDRTRGTTYKISIPL